MTKDKSENYQNNLKPQNQSATKRRVVNFRSFLVVALFLICAVFVALFTCNFPIAGAVLFTVLILFAAGLAVFYRGQTIKMLTFIFCIVVCAVSFSVFLITAYGWNLQVEYDKPISVVGTVESDITMDGTRRIYLKDISLNGQSAKGKMVLYVRTADGSGLATVGNNGTGSAGTGNTDMGAISTGGIKSGSVISLAAEIKPTALHEGFTVFGKQYRNNTRYSAQVSSADLSIIRTKSPGLFIKVREFILEKVSSGMSEHSALCFAFLTGDKAYLEGQVKNYFSAAGLAHILAVSGLHLGFVTALIMFVCKKLKFRRAITAAAVLLFLGLYAFIAGFSPSVSRAAIMSAVVMLVYLFGKRADMLSSLCFAFCIIITFAPFYLFEAGFILSFCCVFTIVLFCGSIRNALVHAKIPKRIADAVAVSVSANIGLFPAIIYVFNNVQLYGLPLNVVLMPLIAVTFISTMLFLFLSVIVPPLAVLFRLPQMGFSAIDFVALGVTQLPFARVVLYAIPAIFVLYAMYFLCSKYVRLTPKWPYRLATVLLAAVLLIVQNPAVIDDSSIVPLDTCRAAVTYLTSGKNGYLTGDFFSGYLALDSLKKLRVRRLDGVFVEKMDLHTAVQLQVLMSLYSDFVVYYPAENAPETGSAAALEVTKKLKGIPVVAFKCAPLSGGQTVGGKARDGVIGEAIMVKSIGEGPERIAAGGITEASTERTAGESAEETQTILVDLNVKTAEGERFLAVYWRGTFGGFAFVREGLESPVSVLMPKSSFRYDLFDYIDNFNIIRAYYYRDAGKKLYLIGEKNYTQGVYSANITPYIYNYKNYKFY